MDVVIRVTPPSPACRKGDVAPCEDGSLAYIASFLRESPRAMKTRHTGPTITVETRGEGTNANRVVCSAQLFVEDDGSIRLVQAEEAAPSFLKENK